MPACAREGGPGLLPVAREEPADPADGGVEVVHPREGEDPEVIASAAPDPDEVTRSSRLPRSASSAARDQAGGP
jgi:hypothetical protein